MLKRITLIIAIASLASNAFSQDRGVPNSIAYQGVLLEKNNRPKPDGNYNFIFEVLDTSGNSIWKSALTTLPVHNGGFVTTLGPFDQSVAFDRPYVLQITVNGEVLAPPIPLLTSAYSFGIADSAITNSKLLSGSVTGDKIAAGTVTGNNIASATITDANIMPGAITGDRIANGTITGGNIATQTILGGIAGNIESQTITGDNIASNTITGGNIQTETILGGIGGNIGLGTITGDNIAGGTITYNNIASQTIYGFNVAPKTIGTPQLADYVAFKRIQILNSSGTEIIDLNSALNSGGGDIGGGVFVYGPGGPSGSGGTNYATGMFGDGTKKFIMRDPTNSVRLINYVCLEGPEAAIYVRGRARLQSGASTVSLPPYFASIAADSSITISLTPRSANSKGLAVVSSSADKFSVQELLQGDGSYDFDYTVMAVRKGFENYQVYTNADKDGNFAGPLAPFSRNMNKTLSK